MVQWLGLSTLTARARVQSLIGELRSLQVTWHCQKKKAQVRTLRLAARPLPQIPKPEVAGLGWEPEPCDCPAHASCRAHPASHGSDPSLLPQPHLAR